MTSCNSCRESSSILAFEFPLLLCGTSLSSLLFLNTFSYNFLEYLSLSFPLRRITNLFLTGNDHMTDLSAGVPHNEDGSVRLIHKNLAYSFRIVLQTMSGFFAPQEMISNDFPLQRVLIELPVFLERDDLLANQGHRGFLDAK